MNYRLFAKRGRLLAGSGRGRPKTALTQTLRASDIANIKAMTREMAILI
jgi:hypothetical protein